MSNVIPFPRAAPPDDPVERVRLMDREWYARFSEQMERRRRDRHGRPTHKPDNDPPPEAA
jgi:hypothetical protein